MDISKDLIEKQLFINDELIGYYTFYEIDSNNLEFLNEYFNDLFNFQFNFKNLNFNSKGIIILDFIQIEAEFKNQGYGSKLFELFLSKAEENNILLVADCRKTSFIVEFYESYDLESIDVNNEGCHLMFFKSL
jgi:GNAT superfamily N-acetyltransferase